MELQFTHLVYNLISTFLQVFQILKSLFCLEPSNSFQCIALADPERFHLLSVHKDYDHKLYLQQNTGVMMIRRKQAVNRKDHAAYTRDKLAEDKLCTANGAH